MLGVQLLAKVESSTLVQFGGKVMSEQVAYRLNKLRTKLGIAFTDERLVDACFRSMCPVADVVEEVVRSQNPGIFNAPTTKPFDPAQPVRKAISLAGYDASLGDLNKLEKAANMFNKYPSAVSKDGPLKKLLEYGNSGNPNQLGTARGAAYELEKAYNLVQSGEEVLEFGKKIGGREFDIVTTTKLIECKNIDWAGVVGGIAGDLKSRIVQQSIIAKKVGKIFELHTKTKIQVDWKKWFMSKGIKFVEDNL